MIYLKRFAVFLLISCLYYEIDVVLINQYFTFLEDYIRT